MRQAITKAKSASSIEEFLALPDEEKERIWESFNREIPESETAPLSKKEQAEWESFVKKARAKRNTSSSANGAGRKSRRQS